MEKTILVLDGMPEGKTKFIEIVKRSGFWIWNLNHRNVLSMTAHRLGWNGERDKNFYTFIDEFSLLVEKHFNFEEWYVNDMLEKFVLSDKANILIIHNCGVNVFNKLKDEFGNCYNVIINDSESEPDCNYCKTMNYNSDDFGTEVIKAMNIMTNR